MSRLPYSSVLLGISKIRLIQIERLLLAAHIHSPRGIIIIPSMHKGLL